MTSGSIHANGNGLPQTICTSKLCCW